jgi:glycosyltransferase involved in cell wall biosynthesis
VKAGYVAQENLPALYTGASALVFPSRMEGFGMPVVEALACGTPVITTANVGALEFLPPDTVTVVPDDSADALADAIVGVLRADSAAPRTARRAAVAGLTWEACARATLGFFEQVADFSASKR